jgi:hypothetical protein
MLWAQAGLPAEVKDNLVYVAAGVGVLVAVVVLWRIATSRTRPPHDPERGLREDLAGYPPPPAAAGGRRLTADGLPVRLRLVVVAPAGKVYDAISPDDVPGLLDEVVRGLGGLVAADKPRIRVWPAPLSAAGFAPTFHRLVHGPDPAGQPSRWVKLAGPARAGQRPFLLGLALWADQASTLGAMDIEPGEWKKVLQVER